MNLLTFDIEDWYNCDFISSDYKVFERGYNKGKWMQVCAQPNWVKFFGKNLYFQDFSRSDPLLFIFGTIENIKRQMNPKFREEKKWIN
jgi:hypothetical protein